jgi:hypothetical protein
MAKVVKTKATFPVRCDHPPTVATGNYQPMIATQDGGVLATAPDGSVAAFNTPTVPTARAGLTVFPTYSWPGEWYESSGPSVGDAQLPELFLPTSYSAFARDWLPRAGTKWLES